MWLPTPIYERVPQFWFLMGLLFIANGLYLGFEFVASFGYVAVGAICSLFGIGIAAMRIKHRRENPSPQQDAAGRSATASDATG